MDLRAVFATNLRRIRKEAGFTQESLGLAAGKHRTYIGAIERQTGNPSLKNIEKILEALDVEPFELFVDQSKCAIIPKSAFSGGTGEEGEVLYSLCVKDGDSYRFFPIGKDSSTLDRLFSALASPADKPSE